MEYFLANLVWYLVYAFVFGVPLVLFAGFVVIIVMLVLFCRRDARA